jgi:hypothetical protein
MRLNRNFLNQLNVIWVVQSSCKKFFAFLVGQITFTTSPRFFPARGAFRDRHGRWEEMWWTSRHCWTGNTCSDGEVVWS